MHYGTERVKICNLSPTKDISLFQIHFGIQLLWQKEKQKLKPNCLHSLCEQSLMVTTTFVVHKSYLHTCYISVITFLSNHISFMGRPVW